ncbi:MAG TPA: Ig-like domain-containing protein [Ferruginibacter sp.]|nr:Ig-like domain-containing protein [Ferruginibacter sp.]
MKLSRIVYFFLFGFVLAVCIVTGFGCAQIGNPTGGPKDTLAPVLVNTHPAIYTTNFKANTITMSFDEYIDLKAIQNNLLVSPYPKRNPTITSRGKTVTIKLKDTLKANTTYAINFGNALIDVHEGNPYKNLTYVFSTGNTIDSLNLVGSVTIAQTGKTDSAILVLLYPGDAPDSAVQKFKPQYVTRMKPGGKFIFTNLPSKRFRIYALGDADGSKTYNAPIEEFAFIDSTVQPEISINNPIELFAYQLQKPKPVAKAAPTGKAKKFKYTTTVGSVPQDILSDLVISFNGPIKHFDESKVILTDTFYNPVPFRLLIDSTGEIITLKRTWKTDENYKLIIFKDAFTDTLGNFLNKTDTIAFHTKKESDYGTLILRFPNIDLSKHPVLQFVQGDAIIESVKLTATEWDANLFTPGEYDLRILYDTNNNGVWDPGDYLKKIQPEKVISFDKKLKVKADWDNEREIKL